MMFLPGSSLSKAAGLGTASEFGSQVRFESVSYSLPFQHLNVVGWLITLAPLPANSGQQEGCPSLLLFKFVQKRTVEPCKVKFKNPEQCKTLADQE
jgi:hypothetical protein